MPNNFSKNSLRTEHQLEIERLLTKHEMEKNLLLTVLNKQTSEIERLKIQVLASENSHHRSLQLWGEKEDRKNAEIERLKALVRGGEGDEGLERDSRTLEKRS